MRRIKNHRSELAHDSQRPHVHHQIVVAETRPAFGEKYPIVARSPAFFNCMFHVPRRDELALLNIYRPLAHGCGDDQVGLAAEKRRNLQHICDLGDLGDIRRFVHVGKHGNLYFIFNLFENAQPLNQPRARESFRIEVRLAFRKKL